MMRSNTNTCFIMKLTFVAAEHLHYDLSAVTFLKKLDRMKEINNQVFNINTNNHNNYNFDKK